VKKYPDNVHYIDLRTTIPRDSWEDELHLSALGFKKVADEFEKRILDADVAVDERSALLMQTMDSINQQFGRGTLEFAAAGLKKGWGTRQQRRSNRWMTRWGEIPVVRA
jgi:hypothetical protein